MDVMVAATKPQKDQIYVIQKKKFLKLKINVHVRRVNCVATKKRSDYNYGTIITWYNYTGTVLLWTTRVIPFERYFLAGSSHHVRQRNMQSKHQTNRLYATKDGKMVSFSTT